MYGLSNSNFIPQNLQIFLGGTTYIQQERKKGEKKTQQQKDTVDMCCYGDRNNFRGKDPCQVGFDTKALLAHITMYSLEFCVMARKSRYVYTKDMNVGF